MAEKGQPREFKEVMELIPFEKFLVEFPPNAASGIEKLTIRRYFGDALQGRQEIRLNTPPCNCTVRKTAKE